MTDPNLVLINIRLKADQIADLERIALHYGHTRSEIIRTFVADGISRFFASQRQTSMPESVPACQDTTTTDRT